MRRIAAEPLATIHGGFAKVGTTAGWVVGAADNLNSLARLPASQTNATLVIPLSLQINRIITGFSLAAQIESGGGTVTIDASLRAQTCAAADHVDSLVASMSQLAVTGDTAISESNSRTTVADVRIANNSTYYLLLTGTTAAACDIDLASALVWTREDF